MSKNLLITGGAGFIGSHTVVELIKESYNCVIVDNFSNSSEESVRRLEKITGASKITFYQVNILDKQKLDEVFKKHKFDAVIHFAGLKAVGESCKKPLEYYHNNVTGSLILLQCMNENNVNKLVFSSSATVYGEPQYLPFDEKHPRGGCSNPYGTTKFVIESILEDAARASPDLQVISLRYFNPVGAHESGLIGEDPQGPPNNLMPYMTQVAIGRRAELSIFGNDYDTPDGTGVRDYIHVVDLALGHVAALKKLDEVKISFKAYNLGTGTGVSVLQIVKAMEKVVGKKLPCKMAPRRAGDIASSYADTLLAEKELNWKAVRNIDTMCADSWRFQNMNTMGYKLTK